MNGANGVSKKREHTAQRIIEALHDSHGLLTLAAQKTGLGYRTVQRYAEEYPSVIEAVREAKEGMLDLAESKLLESIEKREAWAICFYLKTQGKQRGYTERQEVTGADGGAVKYEINVTDSDTKDRLGKLVGGSVLSNVSLK